MSNERDTTFEVQGMTCPSCVRHVNTALTALAGVGAVEVKLREGLVVVKHDAAVAPISSLIDALVDAGYASKARQDDLIGERASR